MANLMSITNKKTIAITFGALVILTLTTSYYGSTDIGDYSDPAKLFAGKYKADIRNSHSYTFGFFHTPYLLLFNNFLIFKLTSLIFLGAIIYSVYIISGKEKKSLLLALTSPAIWYMAPWINPIQIASLLLLWSWYFIKEYDEKHKLKSLVISGLLLGLAWTFWNTILFFTGIIAVVFLINKRFHHILVFALAILVGLAPLISLDIYLFNFPFYTLMKTTTSNFIATLLGGIYGENNGPFSLLNLALVLLTIPLTFWNSLRKIDKTKIFLLLSLLLILTNPQIRYVLAISPIILSAYKPNKNYSFILFGSIILSGIFIIPYISQISNPLATPSFEGDIKDLLHERELPKQSQINLRIIRDLKKISVEYPDEAFIIGPGPDDYATLARLYWGGEIREFVSIQDYEAWEKNQTVLLQKSWRPIPQINARRQIWITGGIGINENDKTDYENLTYAISMNANGLEGFTPVRSYQELSVWEKSQITTPF